MVGGMAMGVGVVPRLRVSFLDRFVAGVAFAGCLRLDCAALEDCLRLLRVAVVVCMGVTTDCPKFNAAVVRRCSTPLL